MKHTLKELVSNKRVNFVSARRGELIYQVEGTGYRFSVPMSDMGDGEFLASDGALLFMRWIRKQLAAESGVN